MTRVIALNIDSGRNLGFICLASRAIGVVDLPMDGRLEGLGVRGL